MFNEMIDKNEIPDALPQSEQVKLFKEMKNGSIEAKEKLIMHNSRLIISEIFKKFMNTSYDKQDLFSVGKIGLIKAVSSYDINKGYKFSSYATKCIDNEILEYIRKENKQINHDTLDRNINFEIERRDIKLIDVISNDVNIEKDYEKKEKYEIIRQVIEKLSDKEREVIKLYFGFYNNLTYTQQEIALKLNVTQGAISRILKGTISLLKEKLKNLDDMELKCYNSKKNK